MRMHKLWLCLAATLATLGLVGCAAVGPNYSTATAPAPAKWYAALPHGGNASNLQAWWQQFDDPLLAQLIEAANAVSDTLASALSRIEQSRSGIAAARSALLPGVNLGASAGRSSSGPNAPIASSARASVDASWEIDLFGGNQRSREAALARYDSSVAGWHAARVSLAAEVATQYVGLRACEALLVGFERDATSRQETDRLTQLKVKAGFTATAEGALSGASVADAQSRLDGQRAECDINVKSLVALSALEEAPLRDMLKPSTAKLPQPKGFAIDTIPSIVLTQRPDISSAERDLAAASADIGVAEAARYPRISLLGSLGALATRASGISSEGKTWSFGPALDLPLFDAGRRAANADAARARYQESLAMYKSRARNAVREVETALTQLGSAQTRETDAGKAASGYEAFLKATQARYNAGAGSLLELEEARRALLNAQVSLLSVQRERVTSWIALYKSLGGGWTSDAPAPSGLSHSFTQPQQP
jgi:outer membrane protein, multidrug efflux system